MSLGRDLLYTAVFASIVFGGKPATEDISLGFVHFEAIEVAETGVRQPRPGVIILATNQPSRVQSYGLSNEAGVLIEPLPPGKYCYDAFSDTGHHLKIGRPMAERCFEVLAGETVEVGVSFMHQ